MTRRLPVAVAVAALVALLLTLLLTQESPRPLADAAPVAATPEARLVIPDLGVNTPVSRHSFGLSNSGTIGGGGGGAGKVEFEPVTLSKRINKASPLLMKAASQGQHLQTAVLTVYRPGSAKKLVTYEFASVIITGLKHSRNQAAAEKLTLDFGQVTMIAGGERTCWNIATNATC